MTQKTMYIIIGAVVSISLIALIYMYNQMDNSSVVMEQISTDSIQQNNTDSTNKTIDSGKTNSILESKYHKPLFDIEIDEVNDINASQYERLDIDGERFDKTLGIFKNAGLIGNSIANKSYKIKFPSNISSKLFSFEESKSTINIVSEAEDVKPGKIKLQKGVIAANLGLAVLNVLTIITGQEHLQEIKQSMNTIKRDVEFIKEIESIIEPSSILYGNYINLVRIQDEYYSIFTNLNYEITDNFDNKNFLTPLLFKEADIRNQIGHTFPTTYIACNKMQQMIYYSLANIPEDYFFEKADYCDDYVDPKEKYMQFYKKQLIDLKKYTTHYLLALRLNLKAIELGNQIDNSYSLKRLNIVEDHLNDLDTTKAYILNKLYIAIQRLRENDDYGDRNNENTGYLGVTASSIERERISRTKLVNTYNNLFHIPLVDQIKNFRKDLKKLRDVCIADENLEIVLETGANQEIVNVYKKREN